MNKRDEFNIVILQYFQEGLLTETEAMSYLKLFHKTEKSKHKYIRSLINEIRNREIQRIEEYQELKSKETENEVIQELEDKSLFPTTDIKLESIIDKSSYD